MQSIAMKMGIRSIKGKWILRAGKIVVLLGLFFLFSAGNALASHTVFVVLSSEAEPYRQAADALTASLAKKDISTREFLSDTLSGQTPEFVSTTHKTKMWVAVGSRAAAYLSHVLPKSALLVYCMVADPENIGLENGRKNITGVSVTKPVKEQFAIIQKAMPDLGAIAMLYRSSSIKSMTTLVEVKTNLPANWTLEAVDVDRYDSMADAIAELYSRDAGMIWTMADSAIYNRATVNSLLLSSLRQQVPVFGFSGSFVKAGALLGLDANPVLQGEYAAALVVEGLEKKLLTEKPICSGVTIAVNVVVAERLGISLPSVVVDKACNVGAH
ncbi:ABC transporter substrate-binding protein [Desulfocapsa sulfexigens]|nr:ABC transporter substrate binding protein [Desulfocapsa sulfexigens]